jgi:CRISPR-associated protein (TIGR03986 family)
LAFHNPYNFVPTCDRSNFSSDFFAGDHDPSAEGSKEDHSRYHDGRYTGTIPVVLRTRTPLFITDPSSKTLLAGTDRQNNAHYRYDTLDYIPATALKGMISSTYEAVTNSRYRVFSKKQHTKKLGMRGTHDPGWVPGRAERLPNGDFIVELFTGTTGPAAIGNDHPAPLYAAWLPMYNDPHNPIYPYRDVLDGTFITGVTIQLYQHRNFKFWSVTHIPVIPGVTTVPANLNPITRHATPVTGQPPKTVDGYMVVSGKLFNRKHDERFFFNDPIAAAPIPIAKDDDLIKNYENLISNYQSVHERGANPSMPGVVQGRHITDRGRKELTGVTFVYLKMSGPRTITAIYPVQISRELYKKSPWECVHKSILPASDMKDLSPADRLFGWVNQNGKGAWKGKIRFSNGIFRATTEAPIPTEQFAPLPLAILGNPKPAQARFYLGNDEGAPQNSGITKLQASYSGNKKLRGRKVYLHQQHADNNYWNAEHALADSPQDREYVMNAQDDGSQLSGQNRSIASWIAPEREFRFDMRVENLTIEELGALLQLLSMNRDGDERCFKLGLGKPLGLGSVTLKLDLADDEPLPVYTGEQYASAYRGFGEEQAYSGLDRTARKEIINAYKKSMADSYGTPSNPVPPAIPNSWRNSSFGGEYVNDANDQKFEGIWNNAFENNAAEFSIDQFEGLSAAEWNELAGDAVEELNALYLKEKNAYKTACEKYYENLVSAYASAWAEISFIKAFRKSMSAYENVHYPRNEPLQLGYEWFSSNEVMEGGKPKHGSSLPEIGKELKFTQ